LFRVSDASIQGLQDIYRHRYLGGILPFLREQYPVVVAEFSDAVILERIEWGLRRVRQSGVKDGRAAALFVVTQFAVGPTFYQYPACAALLTDRRLPPEARVHSLFHADAAIPWTDIALSRDDSAWLKDAS
jgi:hypothetical protein